MVGVGKLAQTQLVPTPVVVGQDSIYKQTASLAAASDQVSGGRGGGRRREGGGREDGREGEGGRESEGRRRKGGTWKRG